MGEVIQLPTGKMNKDLSTKKMYTYMTDPGHGWLSVPYSDLEELGLVDKISPYSYMNASRVFLEEDGDMSMFLEAAARAGWKIEHKTTYSNRASCRSYGNYNPRWVRNPLTIGQHVLTNNDVEATVIAKNDKGWTIETKEGKKFHLPRLNPLAYIKPLVERIANHG
jgi:hypothetical protein